jgi:hypothetical protein
VRFCILLPRLWPGEPTRLIIVVVICILVWNLSPAAMLPTGLGLWLGRWLTSKPPQSHQVIN